MYQYRCEQCRTTSPPVGTRRGVDVERAAHRRTFHGGHIPDGEMVIEPQPFSIYDIPLTQWVAGIVMILVFVVLGLIRHM